MKKLALLIGLLILALIAFFLTTVPIEEDKSVLTKLPPWSDDEPDITKIKKRNIYTILVNANDKLIVRDKPMLLIALKRNVKDFIANPNRNPDYAEKPTRAIISLKNERGTTYEVYLEVLNEIKAAYNELRNELAIVKYKMPFDELTKEQKKVIRNEIPLVISEAEPTAFGEEG